ncbi:hypothetical protein [Peterkaempfera bronchialis]|uniref:Uncharacterized protein n=1 Tax=Peterkaempfera bronchialis TaxID=2126346 RepID=A0A345SSW2_9ACTN|nr:hypothetical protein [Peterkaempfera bronchialis]AXI76817.1 hypothetical protein C7M71_004435 [Peterkaempfera bronchialis]
MNQRNTDVLVDVTSLISAEDFLLSQNRSAPPKDPFARQCFVEVVQSLIFMSAVHVAHPVLLAPQAADFGDRPLLLRELMRTGLLQPLRLDAEQQASAERLESSAIHDLQSVHGVTSMARFVEQTFACDRASVGGQQALSRRIRDWSGFQEGQVRSTAGHHTERIPTRDGVEEDAFGEWARAAAVMLHGALSDIAAPGQGNYLMATLARGMKYRARAESCGISYQSHPMRRDFSLTFDLTRDGADDDEVLNLIQAVRGIHATLSQAAGQEEVHRTRLLQLELPLLGGRLWSPDETGTRNDRDWVAFVVARIRDYRSRAAELRRAVERCVTAEDYVRLARDIEGVKRQLLERLGLRRVELSAIERELVGSVDSVGSMVTGVPVVSGLWFGARSLSKQFGFAGAQPYQRFLYREFVGAWKRAGR